MGYERVVNKRIKPAEFPKKTEWRDAHLPLLETWYTCPMMDEVEFRKAADAAMEELKQKLYAAEDGGDFEVEEQGGALYVVFEAPAGKFVITPNSPVQQIWVSALSTSFKLDLTPQGFILAKTGEGLNTLILRLIEEHAA